MPNEKLIPIRKNEKSEPLVSGRDLHKFLEVKTKFVDWIKDRIEKYRFVENTDFILVSEKKKETNNPKNPFTFITEYILTLDMAKELSMVQNNEKGSQARKYFIAVEKKYKEMKKDSYMIADPITRAERWIEEQKEKQKLVFENKELKPKAHYTDVILQNKSLVTVTQIAKDYGKTGVAFNKLLHDLGIQYKQSGQWLLYQKYQNSGFVHSETIAITGKDGQDFSKMITKWTQKGRLFLYNFLKAFDILPVIERE